MELAELVFEYITAKTKLDIKKADCDGSWGYYLHDEIKYVNDLSKQINEKVVELSNHQTL